MNAGPWGVSIQWGKGLHHWVRTDLEDFNEAKRCEEETKENLRRRERSAKKKWKIRPEVHVWELQLT